MIGYQCYCSHSLLMDILAISGQPFSKSFIDDAFDTISLKTPGINFCLFVYMRVNTRDNLNQNFYEVFFSIDGKLLEIKDLNPIFEYQPLYVIEHATRKRITITRTIQSTVDLILKSIMLDDILGINAEMYEGKSIALLFVGFDHYIINKELIDNMLSRLFNEHFVERIE